MDELDLEDLQLAFHLGLIVLFQLLYIDLVLFIVAEVVVILSSIVHDVVVIVYYAAGLVLRVVDDDQTGIVDVFIDRVFKEELLLFVTDQGLLHHWDIALYLEKSGLSFVWELAGFLDPYNLQLILLFDSLHLLVVCLDHFGDFPLILLLHLLCELYLDLVADLFSDQ